MRGAIPWIGVASAALGACAQTQGTRAPAPGETPGAQSVQRLHSIQISTRDVFSAEDAQARPFYRLFNALHVPTDEAVIRRELWKEPGDELLEWEVEEIERHLRDMGLFGEVATSLEPVGAGEEAILHIDTRDRFSLTTGAGGFFVGGVGGFDASLGDRNLLGSGNRLGASYSINSNDEESGSLSYTDIQFLDSWAQLHVSGGFTDEGSDAYLGLSKNFQHYEDPNAWGASIAHRDSEVDYYASGDTVAEVPQETQGVHLYFMEGAGGQNHQSASGLDLRIQEQDFGTPVGVGSGSIAVPGDLNRVSFGWIGFQEQDDRFLKRAGIDAIDYVEDIPLGSRLEWFLGATHRDENLLASELQPTAILGWRVAQSWGQAGLSTLSLEGQSRWQSGEAVGWQASGAWHVYFQGWERQTLAASLSFDQAFEGQDLPIQMTLGEDNGLRGYPSREFAGTRRLRLNLENRIQTDWKVRSIHLGVVPFVDTGWIGDDSLGSGRSSVGIGLRLGSSEIFGSGVLRIDLAFPLHEEAGESFDPSLSVSLGQVFSLFGNASALRGQ